jgi:hypothetical protein
MVLKQGKHHKNKIKKCLKFSTLIEALTSSDTPTSPPFNHRRSLQSDAESGAQPLFLNIRIKTIVRYVYNLKGLSHEIDFKYFGKKLTELGRGWRLL